VPDIARPTHRYRSRPAQRLTVHLNTHAHVHHHSLVIELLQRARHAKMAGATVFHGVEGYGTSGAASRQHLVGGNAPVVVVVVDEPARIERFLHDLGNLLDDVLVTVHDVDVVET